MPLPTKCRQRTILLLMKCPGWTKCPAQMCPPQLLILILHPLVLICMAVLRLIVQILVQLACFQVELCNLQDLDQNPEQMLVRLVEK